MFLKWLFGIFLGSVNNIGYKFVWLIFGRLLI